MYLDYKESAQLAEALVQENFSHEKMIVVVFPNPLAIAKVVEILASTNFKVGAQDVFTTPKGAYTSAISAFMYKELGCKYALVGHSERRHIFGDTDEDVRKKLEACLDAGLVPVLCIGETKEDREKSKREYRLKKQIMKAFADLDLAGREIIVAYEPVWAISKFGVGEPCSPAEADDVQGWIKTELKNYTDQEIPVIYGGSADAENVISYLSQPMVDGVLPGNASTKLETWLPLINTVKNYV